MILRLLRYFLFSFVMFGLFVHCPGICLADSKKEKVILKLATLAPEGVGWAILIKDGFVPAISKATDGVVGFDFYWGGIMGDDEDYISKIRIDQLQGAGVSASGTVMACPDMAVFELPFLFNDFDEVDYVRKKLRSRLDNIYEKNGFKNLILIDQDFDIPWSVKWPIRSPEDFSKSRFLTWCPPVEDDLLESLGASPIPVNVPEVPSNVRAKVCDAFLAPPIYLVGTQLYTVVKYVTPCKIRYSPGGILISMKAWDRIPQKYHKAIKEILPEQEKKINDFGHDSNEKCLKAMIRYGVNEVKLTPEEIDLLKKRTRPVWDKLAGKDYSRELLDEILLYLSEYRSKNTAR